MQKLIWLLILIQCWLIKCIQVKNHLFFDVALPDSIKKKTESMFSSD